MKPGETLSRSQVEYTSSLADAACFTHDGASVYLSLARRGVTPPMVLLGSTSMPANDQITDASNAAVMLRALGHSGRVVWYVPSREDVPAGGDAGLGSLVPPWLGPVLALGGFAFLGLVLWRGRRFGRLVPEPLPVVVRAVETTESRGRLYRRARDASRAGATLQGATRTRLADYLGLPPQPVDLVPGRRPGAGERGLRGHGASGRRGRRTAPRSASHPGRPSPRARRRARRPREGSTPLMSDTPDHSAPAPAGPPPPPPPTGQPAYPARRPHTTRPAGRPQAAAPTAPAPTPSPALSPAAQQGSDRAREALLAVRREVGKAVVGQDAAVSGVIISLLVRGHVLLEGVPASPRRCSCAPWPRPWPSTPSGSSSRPT